MLSKEKFKKSNSKTFKTSIYHDRNEEAKAFLCYFLFLYPLLPFFLFNSHTTAISQDGRLTTNAYMAEYNQDRFELDIQAKEVQPPERIAVAKVFVSIKSFRTFFCYSTFLCIFMYSHIPFDKTCMLMHL